MKTYNPTATRDELIAYIELTSNVYVDFSVHTTDTIQTIAAHIAAFAVETPRYSWADSVTVFNRLIRRLVYTGGIKDFYCMQCLPEKGFERPIGTILYRIGICQNCKKRTDITNPHLNKAVRALDQNQITVSFIATINEMMIPYPAHTSFVGRAGEKIKEWTTRFWPKWDKYVHTNRHTLTHDPSQALAMPDGFPPVAHQFNRYLGQLLTDSRLLAFYCEACLQKKGFVPTDEPSMTNTGWCMRCGHCDDIENPHITAYLKARGIRFYDDTNPSLDFIRDIMIPWPAYTPE